MIEEILLDYLKDELQVPVFLEIPENPPSIFVLIEKTGSSRENYIENAIFAVQSTANSLYRSASLNVRAKRAMDNSVNLPQISKAQLNSDYNFTDTTKNVYRYQAVYEITHYC